MAGGAAGGAACAYVWEVQFDEGWQRMSPVDTKAVEAAHAVSSTQSCRLPLGSRRWEYIVDFAARAQTNPKTHTRRAIRRVAVDAAGGGGPPVRWVWGRFLGRGSYGTVHAAHDIDRDGSVPTAAKVFKLDQTDESQLEGLWEEVALMESIRKHDRIVRCLGASYIDAQHSLCIFMEFLPGGTFHDLLRRSAQLDEQVAAGGMAQVCDGLAHLHAHKIYHRDLKGENILCAHRPRGEHPRALSLKLADFGASKRKETHRTQTLAGAASGCGGTQMDTAIGTSLWMAPEVICVAQAAGSGYAPGKADVWSCGVVCCEALRQGQPPWPRFENQIQALFTIGQWSGGKSGTDLPPAAPKEGTVSAGCLRFLRRCLHADPKKRDGAAELMGDEWLRSGTAAAEQTAVWVAEQPERPVDSATVSGQRVTSYAALLELYRARRGAAAAAGPGSPTLGGTGALGTMSLRTDDISGTCISPPPTQTLPAAAATADCFRTGDSTYRDPAAGTLRTATGGDDKKEKKDKGKEKERDAKKSKKDKKDKEDAVHGKEKKDERKDKDAKEKKDKKKDKEPEKKFKFRTEGSWTEFWSNQEQRISYSNGESETFNIGESSFFKPDEEMARMLADQAWEQKEKEGRKYYANKQTKESVWHDKLPKRFLEHAQETVREMERRLASGLWDMRIDNDTGKRVIRRPDGGGDVLLRNFYNTIHKLVEDEKESKKHQGSAQLKAMFSDDEVSKKIEQLLASKEWKKQQPNSSGTIYFLEKKTKRQERESKFRELVRTGDIL